MIQKTITFQSEPYGVITIQKGQLGYKRKHTYSFATKQKTWYTFPNQAWDLCTTKTKPQ